MRLQLDCGSTEQPPKQRDTGRSRPSPTRPAEMPAGLAKMKRPSRHVTTGPHLCGHARPCKPAASSIQVSGWGASGAGKMTRQFDNQLKDALKRAAASTPERGGFMLATGVQEKLNEARPNMAPPFCILPLPSPSGSAAWPIKAEWYVGITGISTTQNQGLSEDRTWPPSGRRARSFCIPESEVTR